MSKVKIQGNASGTGTFTISAPNSNTDRSLTLPDGAGEILLSDGDGSNLTGIGAFSPAFKVTNSTTISGTDNVWAIVTFNTEEIDTDNCFASNKFTPTTAGYYYFYGSAELYGNTRPSMNTFNLEISKNGTDRVSQIEQQQDYYTDFAEAANLSGIVYMNGTSDYVELWYRIDTSDGGAAKVAKAEFMGYRLS